MKANCNVFDLIAFVVISYSVLCEASPLVMVSSEFNTTTTTVSRQRSNSERTKPSKGSPICSLLPNRWNGFIVSPIPEFNAPPCILTQEDITPGDFVRITVFVGLLPQRVSIGSNIAGSITRYLNNQIYNMTIALAPSDENGFIAIEAPDTNNDVSEPTPVPVDIDKPPIMNGNLGMVDTANGPTIGITIPGTADVEFDCQDVGCNRLLQTQSDVLYRLTLVETEQQLERQYGNAWWWRNTLSFIAFDVTQSIVVTDDTELSRLGDLLRSVLEFGLQDDGDPEPPLINWIRIFYDGRASFDVTLDGNQLPDNIRDPPTLGFPGNDPVLGGPLDEPVSPIFDSVDPTAWYWQRYLALGVFLTTFTAYMSLSMYASNRARAIRKKQVWGNLNSEEGLERILMIGWKIEGKQMEIFPKKRHGRYEDSLLEGGIEQGKVAPAAPMTFTGNSSYTPDTSPNVSDLPSTMNDSRQEHSNDEENAMKAE